MELAVGNMDKRGDIAAQVEQRVQAYRRLGLSKRGPRKQRQTQIDGRGVQCVGGVFELDAQIVIGVKPAGLGDQSLGEIGIDTPVALSVGVCQCVAGDAATNAHMIELVRLRPQARFDIAQAFSVGQLGERHDQELIEARKGFGLVGTVIAGDTTSKRRQRQVRHQLCEYQLAGMHGAAPMDGPTSLDRCRPRSNRDRIQ